MKTLRDKYCIVGVGETEYSRASNRTTRAMAVEAVRHAILDAGLTARDIDGMLDYQGGDSTLANHVARREARVEDGVADGLDGHRAGRAVGGARVLRLAHADDAVLVPQGLHRTSLSPRF